IPGLHSTPDVNPYDVNATRPLGQHRELARGFDVSAVGERLLDIASLDFNARYRDCWRLARRRWCRVVTGAGRDQQCERYSAQRKTRERRMPSVRRSDHLVNLLHGLVPGSTVAELVFVCACSCLLRMAHEPQARRPACGRNRDWWTGRLSTWPPGQV